MNIQIPAKIGSEMGGEFTYQPKWDPKTVLTTPIQSGVDAEDREQHRPGGFQAAKGLQCGQLFWWPLQLLLQPLENIYIYIFPVGIDSLHNQQGETKQISFSKWKFENCFCVAGFWTCNKASLLVPLDKTYSPAAQNKCHVCNALKPETSSDSQWPSGTICLSLHVLSQLRNTR